MNSLRTGNGSGVQVTPDFFEKANTDPATYKRMYAESISDPDEFWLREGRRIDWMEPYSKAGDCSFEKDDFRIKWFEDGVLNACVNCVDRHLPERGKKTALIWEGDDPQESAKYTYDDVYKEVCTFANILRELGVQKGDRVTIYLPMIPEALFAVLACARIGAVHSVVFGGFSPEALAGRITDCESSCVITADEGVRGGRTVPLKRNVDQALEASGQFVAKVLVIKRTGANASMKSGRDYWLHELAVKVALECPAEPMKAEDPLFILYTSGSTGQPKGVLHTTGGYMVWASMTHEYAFDIKEDDVYWCTADIGWITGHSYIVYGPLANGSTTLMFEGIPTYPDASRFWSVCDKHDVSIFYTAPTAIRALMREGDGPVKSTKRQSLRLLGSVGEPINPEAWEWYYNTVGEAQCPIVDTWWQTETGGCMIAPWPNTGPMKPGAASLPFFGVQPEIVDSNGVSKPGEAEGVLVIKNSWPGQMRGVYGDKERFFSTYFSSFPGSYFSGDGAKRDADGTYWITGRVDDVINVSGHRLGTAEIEGALVAHDAVAEAAVVGFPHDIKGQGIFAYVTLRKGLEQTKALKTELVAHVRKEIGPVASLDIMLVTPGLPKTRSGKIMRRILRKIAEKRYSELGDTSTLAEPEIVDELIRSRAAI